jgi:hypothetical protein
LKGYIGEDGKYHRGEKALGHDVSSIHKEWSHDLERKKFGREIIQPHKNGQPNPAFVKAYPEESKEYFSPEQIKRGEREI